MSEMGFDLGFTDERFHGSCHCCLIYERDEQRRRVVAEYLAAGLQHREVVRYFADTTPAETIRAWLGEKGVDVKASEASGSFGIGSAEAGYCPTGRFEPEVMIAGNIRRYGEAEKAGFTGVRSCGEMSWALGGREGSHRFLEYEALLNTVDVPFRHFGMCQYDARRFDGATLYKVLQVHRYIVAQGQLVQNPYYVKPEEFLASLRSERSA
jgi:hypothetical protein